MKNIGITGQSGFIGTHLFNHINIKTDYKIISFVDSYFEDENKLRNFVKSCDVIIHLAAKNRDEKPNLIYKTNLDLIKKLIHACNQENNFPHIFFSSSVQEDNDSPYGKSKKEGALLFEKWAKNKKSKFTRLVIPNVFGPFAKPHYNTFVSTFAYQLIKNIQPEIQIDNNVDLIFVGSLCDYIISLIENEDSKKITKKIVPFDFAIKVSKVLDFFKNFHLLYFKDGIIPNLKNLNEINLFNTFRSYIDYENHFPINLVQNKDNRGVFVETIRLNIGGQVSFSTTVPGIVRGNHFHTRKIERFTVIKGKAKIQLKKIGSLKVINYYLDGKSPSYVDMPIWYSHNIKNIGDEELITQFWINESYDVNDHDTYIKAI